MLASGARQDETRGFGAGRLLRVRPLTWLGDISYGIYLGHGPVVVFALLLSGESRLGLIEGLTVKR
jgi:peptidoglycan/LPS O-acetylase OafA/YrhL